jgi:hypothetical protein
MSKEVYEARQIKSNQINSPRKCGILFVGYVEISVLP